MNVTCERCQTDYEFDDVLLSSRGTTVKCTNCGLQFKVAGPPGTYDEWVVHTSAGQTLTFRTLKDLQAAILARKFKSDASLERSGLGSRGLEDIVELRPFFERAEAPHESQDDDAARARAHDARRSWVDTLRPPASGLAGVPPPSTPPRDRFGSSTPPPVRAASSDAPGADETPALELASSLPPPRVPPKSLPPLRGGRPASSAPPKSGPSSNPPAESAPGHRAARLVDELDDRPPVVRRRRTGWIVALVLIAGAVVVILAWQRKFAGLSSPDQAALDARTERFLVAGEKALEAGDLETAKENLDKASALDESSARVLEALAVLDARRADEAWLRAELEPRDAGATAGGDGVKELAERALTAVGRARAAKATGVALAAAEVDALRVTADTARARRTLAKHGANKDAAEMQYARAMLDVAEDRARWPEIVDALSKLEADPKTRARARGPLVVALVKKGELSRAREAFERISILAKPHPLARELGALVATESDAGGVVAALPLADDAGDVEPPGEASGEGAGSGDPRALVARASEARRKGNYALAESLFGRALERRPYDSEALSGLGDVAYARRDWAQAKSHYERALAANPVYLPARIGLADVLWETGDQTKARAAYERIAQEAPEGTYPARVKERAGGAGATSQPAASPTEGEEP